MKKLPENGIALFCGEDESEIIIPPLPIPTNRYRCDKVFHTEFIKPLFETHDTYGYLAISDMVLLFTVTGTQTQILFKMQTDLPTNTRRGGQSANRIARIRAEKRDVYRDKIVDAVVEKGKNIKSLIISGHGERPKEISELLTSDSRWLIPILGVIKINGQNPIEETIRGGEELILYADRDVEKKYANKIEELIKTDSDRLVFGKENVYNRDEEKALEVVYSSEKLEGIAADVLLIRTGYLDKFGGIIGVLYTGIVTYGTE